MKKLLLISNSVSRNGGFFDHCFLAIKKLIGRKRILFIPFALNDWNKYEKMVQRRFVEEGIKLNSIHQQSNYKEAILKAKVVFVGGGNTFRLLKKLYDFDLIQVLKHSVESGNLIYIGSSAGANVASPTIMTTNDMPIVELPTLKALALVPFQINPHYIDSKKDNKHRIETRDERINQFHEENETPVIGLREDSYLLLVNGKLRLEGKSGGKLFIKGKLPKELKSVKSLDFLLKLN